MKGQLTLFGTVEDAVDPAPKKTGRKPFTKMQKLHGLGKPWQTCKTCKHHLAYRYHNKWYHKCQSWMLSHSAATDIRVGDPACKKYEDIGSYNVGKCEVIGTIHKEGEQ